AVPGDQLRAVAVDRAEEVLDQLGLVVLRRAEAAHPHAVGIAEDAADRHHPVQVVRQEVVADLQPAPLQRRLDHGVVADVVGQVPGDAQARGVRDRLDVEDEDRGHRRGNTASGSIGLPCWRISKCSFGTSVPELPSSAIFWPRLTSCPSFTARLRLWAYTESSSLSCLTMTRLP